MKATNKDILRTLKKSGMRFFYICSIIAMGVAFFCGIKATSPSMMKTAYSYFLDHKLSDFRLISSYGFRNKDIKTLSEVKGVEEAVGAYSIDVVARIKDSKDTIKISSLPDKNSLNQPLLIEGRYPEKENECVIETTQADLSNTEIGTTVEVLNESLSQEDLDHLKVKTFTIVGYIESPQFVSIERGNTNIGSGELNGYMMVNRDAFDYERYTECYLFTELTASGVSPFTQEYKMLRDDMIETLEDTGDTILDDNLKEIRDTGFNEINKAQDEINKNQNTLDEEIKKGEDELESARDELAQGELSYQNGLNELTTQIAAGERELDQARAMITSGYSELEAGQRELYAQLNSARAQLEAGLQELQANEVLFNTSKEEAQKQLNDARVQIELGFKEYQEGLNTYHKNLNDFNEQIKTATKELTEAQETINKNKEILLGEEEKYNNGLNEFKIQEDNFNEQKKVLEENIEKLDQGITEINSNLDQLNSALKPLTDLENTVNDLTKEENELNLGLTQIENNLNQNNNEISALREELEKDPNNFGLLKRLEELLTEQESLTTQKNTLEEQKKELEENLNTLNNQLNTLKEELAPQIETQAQLEEELKTLNSQKEEISKALSAGEEELKKAKEELDNAGLELTQAEASLTKAQNELDQGKLELSRQEEAGRRELNKAAAELSLALKTLEESENLLNSQENIALKEFSSLKNQLDQAKIQLNDNENLLETSQTQGEETLNTSRIQLQDAQNQLIQGQNILLEQRSLGESQLQQALNTLNSARLQISDGEQKLKTQKDDAQKQIDDAQKKVNDSRNDLLTLSKGDWYVYTRDDNPGYSGYEEDARRIDNVGNVFPLFFLLVAALVAFTTMTRMVEEERTQIGTLYALGFSKFEIIKKYLIYASLAAFIGATIGWILGVYLLPLLIFTAYNILYQMPSLQLDIPWGIIIASYAVAFLCTTGAAGFIAYRALNSVPAELMRPKAPKPGKRILLERIPFIWNHLNFITKVSLRNIFRYKARFFMTIFGIAGCTALLLAGFGLHDAIFTIIPSQYGEVFKYDAMLILKDNEKSNAQKQKDIDSDLNVKTSLLAYQQSVNVRVDNQTLEATLIVPSDLNSYVNFFDLHERTNPDKKLDLKETGMIVNEKLAETYGAKPGEEVEIEIDSKLYPIKVTGEAENYIRHFVYMSPATYQTLTGKAFIPNVLLVNYTDNLKDNEEEQETFTSEKIATGDYTSAVNIKTAVETASKTLEGLNAIVLVMIISAGALAFIVLNNLTTINISERVREIATLKVLGFRDKETNNYIFRENLLLTLIGVILGLFLGVLLLKFIIFTVELDVIMFGREIYPASYIYSILLTLGFAIIVNFTMIPIIKRVNMVEALKEID